MPDKKIGPSCANTTGPEIDPTTEVKSPGTDHDGHLPSTIIPSPGPFPNQSFPPSLRGIALELAEVYSVPVCLPAMSALAFLAGAVGKAFVVIDAYRDKPTFLNLYTIQVVERGLGKGNIGGALSKPILELEKALRDGWSRDCSKARADIELLREKFKSAKHSAKKGDPESRDAMISHQSDIDAAEVFLSAAPAILIDDTTSEALADRLATNGETLLSYSSEAGNLLKVAMGKYSDQGDFDLLLSAYSGDGYKSDRVGRGSRSLSNPRLSALWMVQRTVLDSLLSDKDAFNRGLTARFLLVNTGARRTKDNGAEMVFAKGELWDSILAPFLKLRRQGPSEVEPIPVRCSGEAKEVFRQFHNESVDIEETLPEELQGECSRWRENAIKVAGLFQLVSDKDRMIDERTAEAACAVVRWCGRGYLRLLQGKRLEVLQAEADKLVDICREHGGEVSVGELQSRHGLRNGRLKEVLSLVRTFPNLLSFETRLTSTKPRQVLVAQ
ncbi:DUF3987 domain-containing protein [Puniceicoccales bacterium CK1056]|uniref:DUF3987 domain-containing protein n=1 Tax=Oceanipulchritudo coccoides TaxID=2706888 RepID=A0A6B2M1J1_9BACT|nr:DUF3987 domain-containing protein [Oceanipulchritudo coccoides]NDV61655.1 DUF3987 domain-containing protein [Oceanipulchritudo coccoides]